MKSVSLFFFDPSVWVGSEGVFLYLCSKREIVSYVELF